MKPLILVTKMITEMILVTTAILLTILVAKVVTKGLHRGGQQIAHHAVAGPLPTLQRCNGRLPATQRPVTPSPTHSAYCMTVDHSTKGWRSHNSFQAVETSFTN